MRLTLLILVTVSICNVQAQTFIGISCDIGNQMSYQPNVGDEAYFKKPVTVSGSITFLKQEEMRNNWFLQYGVSTGIIGYNVKFVVADTLSKAYNPPEAFLGYSTVYGSVQFDLGKQVTVMGRKFSLLLGGGVTRYWYFFPDGDYGSLSIGDPPSFTKIFDYYLLPAQNRTSAFAEMSIQTHLYNRISIGLMYRYHFKECLTGEYNFYHYEKPSNGNLSLTQRAFSILFLFRFGKLSHDIKMYRINQAR